MRYLLLLYSEPDSGPADGTPEQAASMKRWFDYTEQMQAAGAWLGGEPLHGVETATTLRRRSGEQLLTDGPFAETKEILGGFYLIDVDNVDEAVEWADRCPISEWGSVEIRPVMELG